MSAKSLGTLPVIHAVDELQNPLSRTKMSFEGDRNSIVEGEMVSFHIAKGFGYRFNKV